MTKKDILQRSRETHRKIIAKFEQRNKAKEKNHLEVCVKEGFEEITRGKNPWKGVIYLACKTCGYGYEKPGPKHSNYLSYEQLNRPMMANS